MCIFANKVDVKEYGQTQDIMFLIGVYMYSPATFICWALRTIFGELFDYLYAEYMSHQK